MLGSMNAWIARGCVGRVALLAALGLGIGTGLAVAQQDKQAPQAPSTEQSNYSAWVKLCAKREQIGNALVCLIKYEELDPRTGNIQLAVAARTVEGEEKPELLVNVPTSYSLMMPAGVRIRVDEHEPLSLQYALCLPTNCQVRTDLTKELLDRMRKGNVLLIGAIGASQKPLTFQVPLKGFSTSYDGAPVDTVKYQETRRRMLEFAKKTAEDQRKNQQPNPLVEAPAQPADGSNVTVAPRKAPPAQASE